MYKRKRPAGGPAGEGHERLVWSKYIIYMFGNAMVKPILLYNYLAYNNVC
jgi:hypothetical protein